MSARIPKSDHPRVLIIGAGFGGLKLARKLINKPYQVVLIDRNNYHQFQPLFYQVATAGLAPSAISFPIRKLFHRSKNVHFRVAEVQNIDTENQKVESDIGDLEYDFLVLATGAATNFFGNTGLEKSAFGMKSTEESLQIRNHVLECMELALTEENDDKRKALMTIVIVGAGPTGVELSGSLSEMKRFVLPNDYPELDFDQMSIYLIEAGDRILGAMSEKSSGASHKFLEGMGVNVKPNTRVLSYDGMTIKIEDNPTIEAKTLIWAAGVSGNIVSGLGDSYEYNRIVVDKHCQVAGYANTYAIGDVALMKTEDYPNGHPQVAQVAMQHADLIAHNLLSRNTSLKSFKYLDFGSLATVGRSKAVADIAKVHFNGFFAWLFWLFVHLMKILGVKNKLFIFIDWMWYYVSFDQSLRLVIKQKKAPAKTEADL